LMLDRSGISFPDHTLEWHQAYEEHPARRNPQCTENWFSQALRQSASTIR
jgi:hypothetical protein